MTPVAALLVASAVVTVGPRICSTFTVEYPKTGDLLNVQLYGELGEVVRVTVTPKGAGSFVR